MSVEEAGGPAEERGDAADPLAGERSYVPHIAIGFVLFCILMGFVMLGLSIFYFDRVWPGQRPALSEPKARPR